MRQEIRFGSHNEFHSAAETGRPRMVSTSAIIILSSSADYSAFDGMASLWRPKIMNECPVPAKGPSKPSTRKRRMRSRRLQGVHRLMNWLLVDIDAGDHGQRVGQFHPQKHPVFQGGA